MASEIGSIQPNPYLFNIENRRKRKARLAHEIGAGARCRKCEDKCPGFQLHFWRKLCQNCRCGKDDHEVEDDDEDIGKIVIGKLFERPIRTKQEEQLYSYGTDLEMINDSTGQKEKLKFDWLPPGVERGIAKRYMEMLPPDKRPVAGSKAAKERRRQLEQQFPLYDMDESERCETLPPAELQNFHKYLEMLRTRVAGQGSVQEIVPVVRKQGPAVVLRGQSACLDNLPPPPDSWINSDGSSEYQNNVDNARENRLNNNDGSESGPGSIDALSPKSAFINNLLTAGGERRGRNLDDALGGMSLAPNNQVSPAFPHPPMPTPPPPPFKPSSSSSLGSQYTPEEYLASQQALPPHYPPPPPPEGETGYSNNNNNNLMTSQNNPMTSQNLMTSQNNPMTSQNLMTSQNNPMTSQNNLMASQTNPMTLQNNPMTSQNNPMTSHNLNSPMTSPSKSSVIQLTSPKPFFAKSEEQNNIKAGQFSSRLPDGGGLSTKMSPSKGQYGELPLYDRGSNTGPNYQPSFAHVMNANEKGSPLLQMTPRDGRVFASDATQAPYAAQKDTIVGPCGRSIGDGVTVLLPQESELLIGPKEARGRSPLLLLDDANQFACQYCKAAMNSGDVAVICERAGPGKYWHPKCFVCVTCQELLADLIYFYKDGQVFCGRHYTQAADIPRCKACDELIFGDSWTRADGCDWHLHHFCCFVCDSPLAGSKYVPDEKDFPHCLSCFMSFKAKMCETCEDKISPSATRAGYNGYFYHASPQCFCCFACRTPLIGKRFKMVKNWVFCSQDCVQASQTDIANNFNPKKKEEV